MKFPSGIRFRPTDQELIVDYLHRKLLNNLPEEWNAIKDVDLYKYHPTELEMMDDEEKSYFFTPIQHKYLHGNRVSRLANNGFWKATSVEKVEDDNKKLIGLKRTLVFYDGIGKNAKKTNWIMHEYSIERHNKREIVHNAGDPMKLDHWVLCSIYERQKKMQYRQNISAALGNYVIKDQQVPSSIDQGEHVQMGEHINQRHLNEEFPLRKRRRTEDPINETALTENATMADTTDNNYTQENTPEASSLIPYQETPEDETDFIDMKKLLDLMDFTDAPVDESNFSLEYSLDSWVIELETLINTTTNVQENPNF